MKKCGVLFLIFSVLLLTGCDTTYNLDISPSGISESVFVQFDSNDPYDHYFIPAFFGELEFQDQSVNFLEKVKGIEYYNSELLNKSGVDTLNYSYNFNEKNFKNSNFVNSAYHTFIFKKYDHDEDGVNDYMLLTTDDDLKIYDILSKLDYITVNITCHYEVISSNADIVDGNTYTWNISKKNLKSINMVYNPDNFIDDRSFFQKLLDGDFRNIFVSLLFLGILVIFGLIYLFMKRRSDKINEI